MQASVQSDDWVAGYLGEDRAVRKNNEGPLDWPVSLDVLPDLFLGNAFLISVLLRR